MQMSKWKFKRWCVLGHAEVRQRFYFNEMQGIEKFWMAHIYVDKMLKNVVPINL